MYFEFRGQLSRPYLWKTIASTIVYIASLILSSVFFQVTMILEQMRLCLAKKDYVRTQIISKKVTTRFFDSGKVNDLKLKFYR